MGNLYTQIVRRHDSKLDLLSQLKQEWLNYPRNYKKIRSLQLQLDNLLAKKKRQIIPRKLSGIELGYQARLKQEALAGKLK